MSLAGNNSPEIGRLERRVELLEDTVAALVGVIEDKLNIDPWDDYWATEQFRKFKG